jgi:hypothetical protein
MVAHATSRSPVLALWARLELSVVLWMVLAIVLSARPLLEVSTAGLQRALSTTATVFGAFMLGELVGMSAAAWLRGTRSGRVVRPIAAVIGLASAIVGMFVASTTAGVACYALAGAGAEVVAASTMRDAVTSPLLRRSTELVALTATCAAVVAVGAGIYFLASGPPQGIWTFVVCGAGQVAVVLITVLYALYPPRESDASLA